MFTCTIKNSCFHFLLIAWTFAINSCFSASDQATNTISDSSFSKPFPPQCSFYSPSNSFFKFFFLFAPQFLLTNYHTYGDMGMVKIYYLNSHPKPILPNQNSIQSNPTLISSIKHFATSAANHIYVLLQTSYFFSNAEPNSLTDFNEVVKKMCFSFHVHGFHKGNYKLKSICPF